MEVVMIRSILSLLAASLFLFASPLHAQSRTWVSGVGDDMYPCSRTAPCKTFAGAILKTSPGGEIDVLDSGGFGTVTITKSITIDGSLGPMASILSANTTGVVVNGASIVVTLRNLTINGVGNVAGNVIGNGIRIVQAGAVNIDNVVIENFSGSVTNGRGVAIETSANVKVNIQDSKFYNLTNFAIHSNPTAGNVILWVDGATIARGGTTAIQLRQFTTASINRTSVTGHNPGAAVALELSSVVAHISNCFFANNAYGVYSGNGGAPVARLYGTVITGSAVAGLDFTGGGQILSYGNNGIRGNSGNEAPSALATGTQ
jgi:hypothetical protein